MDKTAAKPDQVEQWQIEKLAGIHSEVSEGATVQASWLSPEGWVDRILGDGAYKAISACPEAAKAALEPLSKLSASDISKLKKISAQQWAQMITESRKRIASESGERSNLDIVVDVVADIAEGVGVAAVAVASIVLAIAALPLEGAAVVVAATTAAATAVVCLIVAVAAIGVTTVARVIGAIWG